MKDLSITQIVKIIESIKDQELKLAIEKELKQRIKEMQKGLEKE